MILLKKYIRAVICIIWTAIKFLWIKLTRGSSFRCAPINMCSPCSEVELNQGGILKLSKGLKMRSQSHIRVRKGATLTMGEDVSLQYGDMIVCRERIEIGNNVQLSPNVLIYDHDHDFRTKDGLKNLLYKTSPVHIGSNVWIGANTVILRGTVIEDNCVIGAGCVVKGHVKANTVLVQKKENIEIAIKD